ncbi:hypothetical protein KL921_000932 [Ogataea angusta]|uniref:Uncharacterized protein n=1 Tax=Pichia angusta TaxID=870730 RepID=A0ABQ7S3Q5_PICAN|nr:hypothetical protein KL921_000932 [Ogataea angusta]KAG7826283.1 hypothetical protein KL909_000335 [Ogataea angusta]KAG7831970.1 hypothetical protein KL920_000305 [Ogataea angusta]KAG7836142.1 hypothetical protein KL943_001791 [Ogataea angusta]KAG7843208.1 hypothetical protein KL942_000304 [Ogataea angusta]
MAQSSSKYLYEGRKWQPSSTSAVYLPTKYASKDLLGNYNHRDLSLDSTPKVGIPPSEIHNPFLQNTSVHQGTFYVIFLPIVAGFVLAFLIGSAYHRFRAKSQAKDVNSTDESFDSDYSEPLDEGGAMLGFLRDRSHRVANEITNPRCSKAPNSSTKLPANKEKVYYQPLTDKHDVTTLQLRKLEISPSPNSPFSPPQRPSLPKKAISSVLLDEFIETGEIPAIVEPLASNDTKEHTPDPYLSYQSSSPSRASRTSRSSHSYSRSPKRHLVSSKSLSRSDKSLGLPSN